MNWIICACLLVLFSGLANGHNIYEGRGLVQSGYHICPGIQTMPFTSMVSFRSPYTQLKPCGGWLPWKMCSTTMYTTVYQTQIVNMQIETKQCCEGYEQLGSLCVLGLNRSSEFTTKPGTCPVRPATLSSLPCQWDTDCPHWQKCCSTENQLRCVEPNTHVNVSWWLNVTLTVKAAYSLVNTSDGMFNHTRLLHSVVTGALASPAVSVYQTFSWLSGFFSVSSSVLLGSSQLLSMSDITNKLQLLVETIEEVIAVDVSDVDECTLPVLRECSSLASCTNTHGSYTCTCATGYTDLYPSRPGTQCINRPPSSGKVISIGPLRKPPINKSLTSTSSSTTTSSTQPSSTTILPSSSMSLPPSFSLPTITLNSTDSSLPPACIIPTITNLRAHNVTGTSFTLSWDVPSQDNITSHIVLSEGAKHLNSWETTHSDWAITGLQPGVLYTVVMALCMCGHCGSDTVLKVKTEGQTLEAVARITDMNFTAALRDPNSEEYKTFTDDVKNEIMASLSADVLAMVQSGMVIVLITGLSEGSVVVTFTLIFPPIHSNSTQDPLDLASALMGSLKNSQKFKIDSALIHDVEECSLGKADCSPWADCKNTFGSYTCECRSGYTDANPARPGRTCQASDMTTTSARIPTTPATESPLSNINLTLSATSQYSSRNNSTFTPHNTNTSHSVAFMPSSEDTKKKGISPTLEPFTTHTTKSAALTPSSSFTSTSVLTLHPSITLTEAISVDCGLGVISVAVLKSFLQYRNISDSSLYLGQPNCGRTEINTMHVQIIVFWDNCGALLQRINIEDIRTLKELVWNYVVNQKTVQSRHQSYFKESKDNSQYTTLRTTLFYTMMSVKGEVPIICTYSNSLIISMGYNSIGYAVTDDAITGSGMFHVNIRLLNGTNPLPENYTLSADDEVIIEVGLNSTLSQIKVVINKCWANPSGNPADTPAYVFVDNSCPVLNTYTTMLQNGNSTRSLISVNLYQLVAALEVIYLHCQIQICIETETATCHPNCLPTARLTSTARAANMIGMTKASCGPIMKTPTEREAEDMNMRTLRYILPVLGLCVMVLVGAAVWLLYRRRMGNYNFQFKSQQENFTYHVFDT